MKSWKNTLPIAVIAALLLEIVINGGAWWKAGLVVLLFIYFIMKIIKWIERWAKDNEEFEGG